MWTEKFTSFVVVIIAPKLSRSDIDLFDVPLPWFKATDIP